MSHSVNINLIGDSTIQFNGKPLNIHDIRSIEVNGDCEITALNIIPPDTTPLCKICDIKPRKCSADICEKCINEMLTSDTKTDKGVE